MNPYKPNSSKLPRIVTQVPKAPDIRFQIMEAARQFVAAEEDERLRHRRAEIAAIRRELDSMRSELPGLIRAMPRHPPRIPVAAAL